MKTMQDYELRCTAEQTFRAYDLGAPIQRWYHASAFHSDLDHWRYKKVTTEQMITWLRKEKHFRFYITDGCFENINIRVMIWDKMIYNRCGQTADNVLAAIDAALDYLEKGGTK